MDSGSYQRFFVGIRDAEVRVDRLAVMVSATKVRFVPNMKCFDLSQRAHHI